MSSLRNFYFGIRLPTTTEADRADFEDIVNRLILVNARANRIFLRKNPETPMLYDSGVLYAPPEQADGRPKLGGLARFLLKRDLRKKGFDTHTIDASIGVLDGTETLYGTGELYGRGKGDCNELVPARLAELWRAGVMAGPLLIKDQKDDSGWVYHVLIKNPDGTSEDPSLILGMGGPEAADLRKEECRQNAERYVTAKREGKNPAAFGYLPLAGKFSDPYAAGLWNGGRA